MGEIKSIRCIVPFINFEILPKGYCFSCCRSWTSVGHIGKIDTSMSIMDVWNSKKMQYIRNAIFENRLDKVCNFKYCPLAIHNYEINMDTIAIPDLNYKNIIEQIKQRKTILETLPYSINIASSGTCNIRCIMCESNDKYTPTDSRFEDHLYKKLLPEVLPNLSRLILTGNGDPIFNKRTRQFMQNLDADNYPSLKIKLITNGLMLTPKIWETIKHLNFDSINVSIDAATKETYEYVRRKGKWDLLIRNLNHISELRKQGKFSYFILSFVVMKSNYQEIKKFVEMGKEFGCDEILFQKNFHLVAPTENIDFTKDMKTFVEIARIMQDPVFNDKRVDATLIDEYRSYNSSKISIYSRIYTELKWRMLYIPLKFKYLIVKFASTFHETILIPIRQSTD